MFENLVFSKIKDNKINIRYKSNKKNNNLFIQTPILKIDSKSILNNKLNVYLSNTDFCNFYKSIELYILNYIATNSKKFLGEYIDLDILEDYFKTNLLHSNTNNVKLKFNLNYINNILSTLIYDIKKREIDLDECSEILKNNRSSNIVLLFTIDNVLFVDNIFKLELIVHQIKFIDEIVEQNNMLLKYNFLDSDSYDNNMEYDDDPIDYIDIEELEKKELIKEINKEKEIERLKLVEKKYNSKKSKNKNKKNENKDKVKKDLEIKKNIIDEFNMSNINNETIDDYIRNIKKNIL
tara:strand:- start:12427 stop:13308 length:882 start_codon:yes stop_codon:yes gene_type:complete